MSKVIKLALYGDSLALPRINTVKYSERYFFLIQQSLKENNDVNYFELKDRAQGTLTICELLEKYDHDLRYYDYPGDIIIFQVGIVDCAPRPINDKTRGMISKLPNFIKNRIIKYLHKNRNRILKKGKFYVKTEKKVFYNTLETLIKKASNDYKRVYFITICPTNNDTEARSPGFTKNINDYNDLIKKAIVASGCRNILTIDINKYINDRFSDIDLYVTRDDGHHITPLTHSIIADQIIECEKTQNSKLC